MLGIRHFKAEPTEFTRMRVRGKVKKEGTGVSGFYMPFRTTIELLSTTARDHPFVFNEISQDNQKVTLQGGFVYRVVDPNLSLEKYNFSIDPVTGDYLTEDTRKLPQHILQSVRGEARGIIQTTPLEDLLVMGEDLSQSVSRKISESDLISDIGVEFRLLYFDSIVPTPEIAKALEADYRESLLQKSDQAIYKRRAEAVENERTIRSNEMKTEIEMEEKRKELVELEGQNAKHEAQTRADAQLIESKANAERIQVIGSAEAEATKKQVEAYSGVDPMLMATRGLYELGQSVESIGDVNITPEVISAVSNLIKSVRENDEKE